MTQSRSLTLEPDVKQAVDELISLIRTAYPSARFEVRSAPDDASTTLLEVTVEVDDPEEVLALVFERMEELRIDEGVPILVVPLQTLDRAAALPKANMSGAPVTMPAALS